MIKFFLIPFSEIMILSDLLHPSSSSLLLFLYFFYVRRVFFPSYKGKLLLVMYAGRTLQPVASCPLPPSAEIVAATL